MEIAPEKEAEHKGDESLRNKNECDDKLDSHPEYKAKIKTKRHSGADSDNSSVRRRSFVEDNPNGKGSHRWKGALDQGKKAAYDAEQKEAVLGISHHHDGTHHHHHDGGHHHDGHHDHHQEKGPQHEKSAQFKSKLVKNQSHTWKRVATTRSANEGSARRAGNDGSARGRGSFNSGDKAKVVEKYRRFTPAIMHRQLTSVLAKSPVLQPTSESVFASVLLADISGFTMLSQRLTADQLKHHINSYFTILLGIVKKNGGDVIKFLGDAVLIIFPIDKDSSDSLRAASVLMASLCALRLTQECGLYDRGEGVNRVTLSLHCAVGCGNLNCMVLGEGQDWEFLVAGDPLLQIGEGISNAEKGEVCLSAGAYEYVQDKLEAKRTSPTSSSYILTGRRTPLPSKNRKDSKGLRFNAVNGVAPVDAEDDPFPLLEKSSAVTDVRKFLQGFLIPDAPSPDEVVGKLPKFNYDDDTTDEVVADPNLFSVLGYFAHGPASAITFEGAGASELRNVTTIFVEFIGLTKDFIDGDIRRPQAAVASCVQCLRMFGGALLLYTVDDKGVLLIGAFGIPGSSHEDNSRRAVETSLCIREMLQDEGIGCKQGIAEGRVFSGIVGNDNRCVYTIMGSSVNLAARLMGKCKVGEILVNETVYSLSQSAFVFKELPKVAAKGYVRPVAVYKPVERAYSNELLNGSTASMISFVGRRDELATLTTALQSCSEKARCIVIEGPPNVGKTRLVAEVLKVTMSDAQLKLKIVVGTGMSAHLSANYHTIRQILEQITGVKKDTIFAKKVDAASDPLTSDSNIPADENRTSTLDSSVEDLVMMALREWITTYCTLRMKVSTNPDDTVKHFDDAAMSVAEFSMLDLLPLLGEVMGVKVPDTPVTAGLDSRTRKQATEELILRCMSAGSSISNLAIVVDNLQWCDQLSLKALTSFIRSLQSGVFLGMTRTIVDMHKMGGNDHGDNKLRQARITELTGLCTHMKLPSISRDDVVAIVENTIGPGLLLANSGVLSDENIQNILERSNGSPLHVSIIAGGIKNSLTSGVFRDVEDLPEASDSLVISRYDKLSARDQVTVKTASIIGLTFSIVELKHVLIEQGLQDNVNKLDATLSKLVDTDLIKHDGEDNYSFVSRSVQKGVYNVMLPSQRENVHGIVAAYFEGKYLSNEDCFKDVVHHYTLSDKVTKKCLYLQRSAALHESERAYVPLYKTHDTLVTLATGYNCELLVEHSTGAFDTAPKSCLEALAKALRSFGLFGSKTRKKDDQDNDAPKPKRWLLWSDFQIKAYVNQDSGENWTKSKVMAWLATSAMTQFMLGNMIESNNLILLCAYNLNMFPKYRISGLAFKTAKRKTSYSKRKLSGLPGVNQSTKFVILETVINDGNVPFNLECEHYFNVLSALEYVVVMFLMRGLGEPAAFIANSVSDIVTNIMEKSNFEELQTFGVVSRSVRVDTLFGMAMLSISSNEYERNKAIEHLLEVYKRTKMTVDSASKLDVWLKMFLAVHYLSLGEVNHSLHHFGSAEAICTSNGDRVTLNLCYIGEAWCAFLAGKLDICEGALDQVLSFASTTNHLPLHIWALELNVLINTFVGDYESVHEDLRLIRSLQRKDKVVNVHCDWCPMEEVYGATTSAIVAFSLSMQKSFDKALPYAMYACTKLSSRQQGSALGGILLFCAMYALLDVYENKLDYKRGVAGAGSSSLSLTSSPSVKRNNGNNSPEVMQKIEKTAKSALNALSQLAVRFTHLDPLVFAISLRMNRLEGADPELLDIFDGRLKALPDTYQDDVFACAYIHLQRAIFCEKVNASYTFRRKGDSRLLAKDYFAQLGYFPEELQVLGDRTGEGEEEQYSAGHEGSESAESKGNSDSDDDDSDCTSSSGSASNPDARRRGSSWFSGRNQSLSSPAARKMSRPSSTQSGSGETGTPVARKISTAR